RSSGSSRADNAVEPTRSQNITVSCRRSASMGGAGASGAAAVTMGRALWWVWVQPRSVRRSHPISDGDAQSRQPRVRADPSRGTPGRGHLLGGKPPQLPSLNNVDAKSGRITSKPKASQPRRYVHAVILGSE